MDSSSYLELPRAFLISRQSNGKVLSALEMMLPIDFGKL